MVIDIDSGLAGKDITDAEPVGKTDDCAQIARVLEVVKNDIQALGDIFLVDDILRLLIDGYDIAGRVKLWDARHLLPVGKHDFIIVLGGAALVIPRAFGNEPAAIEVLPRVAHALGALGDKQPLVVTVFLGSQAFHDLEDAIVHVHHKA